MKARDYAPISTVLADLREEGLETPSTSNVRYWVTTNKIRAMRVGAGRLLVSYEDVRRMCTPRPVGAA
ncbi:hypothetical protein [Mycobacterium seoulense]|uniref:hypothetical protein n=1 Tax=Mycobacterium seoulense TaxID=386911 RepID=UPI003CEE1C8F